MSEAELNLLKNADTIANFERAVEDARHYILMDTDTFAVRVGDIVIRRIGSEMKEATLTPKK